MDTFGPSIKERKDCLGAAGAIRLHVVIDGVSGADSQTGYRFDGVGCRSEALIAGGSNVHREPLEAGGGALIWRLEPNVDRYQAPSVGEHLTDPGGGEV